MPGKRKTDEKRCTYETKNMELAIDAVKNKGFSLGAAAVRFNVPKSTLGKHYRQANLVIGGGRKPELSEDDENILALFLKQCGTLGYGFTKLETLKFVTQFVNDTKMKTRWNEKGPGDAWFSNFLKRHPELSIRKGEILGQQRVRGADPYVILNWYKNLKNVFKQEKITSEDGALIFNCDESGFCHDPKDVKLIAQKGLKRVSKNIAGSGKKCTTVLACCSADGNKMPPFIIFEGSYVWSNWIPEDDYPGTAYTAQNKGWMEGDIFHQWFQRVFLKNIPPPESRTKKVILIYDGASSHLTYKVAKLAFDNNVILIRLPPNMTHYMQPLDKTVFKPLKTTWNKMLIDYNRENPGTVLPNKQFSKFIKELWNTTFKPELIISGFKSTGIFPVDQSKFPEDAYDAVKLQRFKNGQTSLVAVDSVEPLQVVEPRVTITTPSSCSRPEQTSSIENFIKHKLCENLTKKHEFTKRIKLTNNVGDILTSKEALKKLKEKEELKKSKTKRNKKGKTIEKGKNKLSKATVLTKKVQNKTTDQSSSSENDDIDNVILESDTESEDFDFNSDDETMDIQSVNIELNIFYGVYYDNDWYIGQVKKVLEQGKTEMTFLHFDKNEKFTWPKKPDIATVDNDFIFYGPLDFHGPGPFIIKRHELSAIKAKYKSFK